MLAEVSDASSSDSASEEAALVVELAPDIAAGPAEVAAESGAGDIALAGAGAKALPKPAAKANPKAAAGKAVAKAKAKAKNGQQLFDIRIMDEWGDTPIGSIKIDEKRKQLNAHCRQLGQPGSSCDHRTVTMPECRVNRKVTASNKPLGKVRL